MQKELYKKSRIGKIQQWGIKTDSCYYRTYEGFIDGVLSYSEWSLCEGKNTGRSNETSAEEQAIKEAAALIKKQYEKGWADTVELAKTTKVKIAPMLAHKYKDFKPYVKSLKLIAVQPKFDGIRCAGTIEGMWTRTGKPIIACPHIEEEIEELLELLPRGTKLDGELYNHDLHDDFNTITSIVRKSVLSSADLDKSHNIMQYHVYDVDMKGSFINRFHSLKEIIEANDFKFIKLSPTYFLEPASSTFEKDLDAFYKTFLGLGFEGQMIRNADSEYEHYRSKYLLKRKEMITEEFEIVDIKEGRGNRSGMAGSIIFDGFDAGIKGTEEYFTLMLIDKHMYIGLMATVQYQALTPIKSDGTGGVPRFPVVIGIRDYE